MIYYHKLLYFLSFLESNMSDHLPTQLDQSAPDPKQYKKVFFFVCV